MDKRFTKKDDKHSSNTESYTLAKTQSSLKGDRYKLLFNVLSQLQVAKGS